MRILIVDDIPINRKVLRATLEAEGETVLDAEDGIAALRILETEKVDGVVSDILMPRMDGYRLCHEIRAQTQFQHLPVVMYTATYTTPQDQKLAHDLGASAFLKKPAPVEDILAALGETLGQNCTSLSPDPIAEVAVLRQYSERLVNKLEQKNIELEERLRLAALSAEVGRALVHGNSLQEILQRCAEALVTHVDAAFARIWINNERDRVLELRASAGLHTNIEGARQHVPYGECKLGRIAEEQTPHLTNCLYDDPEVADKEWARQHGLVSHAGYPLVIDGRTVGVMIMFARAPLTQATLDKLASIGDSVALGIRRRLADDELRVRTRELAELNARLAALDRSKSGFLSLISHEFRTPLNGLLGIGELILDDMASTEENSELHRLFDDSRERILGILDDALLLTRIDAEKGSLRFARVPLVDAVNRALESVGAFAAAHRVTLSPMASAGESVFADEALLQRALSALLESAISFSAEGQTVRLTSGGNSGSGGLVIETSGKSIPEQLLATFFELFAINEADTTGGQLGMGPAVAHRILALFGASVYITNRIPDGIRIEVAFPDAMPVPGGFSQHKVAA